MGRKRKTYKEKIVSDLRRKVYSLESVNTHSFVPENKNSSSIATLQNQVRFDQNQSTFVLFDIKKTSILTASIIAIQIILFLILKNNIVSIPGISY
ncbi:MAG: hypothetical protein ACD_50C00207G0009 [uncultured bacterium]|nr:MAG: hypothetical protein ACD_50C00207G0009 [uncultured bacterium]OGH13106.1 MAG: hypothetical protein A2687_00400 [Candidatus Levybacteria bacterium RIFCSPHIGHO2_01_FULL_38_26]